MRLKTIAVSALALAATGCATTYTMTPVDRPGQSVRYDHGAPTADIETPNGAVQVTPLEVSENGRLVFGIAAFNNGKAAANFGVENITMAEASGEPLRVYTRDDLVRQAKNRATWAAIATGLAGAAAAYSANQNAYSHDSGTLYTPHGVYSYQGTHYDATAAAVGTAAAGAATGAGLVAIHNSLDTALTNINGRILQTSTIEPQQSFGGQVIVQKPKAAAFPKGVSMVVHWNGAEYPFSFTIQSSASKPKG